MISDLGRIEDDLRIVLDQINSNNIGFARDRLNMLIESLEETPLSLIMINTQAVRALERATENRIDEERELMEKDFQKRFEERLEANGLTAVGV